MESSALRTGSEESRCDDGALNRWLSLCTWLHPQIDYSEHLAKRPPDGLWPIGNDVRFEGAEDLPAAFVDSCSALRRARKDWPSWLAAKRTAWEEVSDRCPAGEEEAWLRQCVAEALDLPGLTRSELLANFRTEGGISTAASRVFVHRRCAHLKVRVAFLLASPEQYEESFGDRIEAAETYIGTWVVD